MCLLTLNTLSQNTVSSIHIRIWNSLCKLTEKCSSYIRTDIGECFKMHLQAQAFLQPTRAYIHSISSITLYYIFQYIFRKRNVISILNKFIEIFQKTWLSGWSKTSNCFQWKYTYQYSVYAHKPFNMQIYMYICLYLEWIIISISIW